MTRTIWVTWSFIGFHRYPDAPMIVRYLSSKHRHTFNVRVELEVLPDVDRELEFHMVLNLLRDNFSRQVNDQDLGSCETMCDILSEIVLIVFPDRAHTVSVDEDGESGSSLVVAIL